MDDLDKIVTNAVAGINLQFSREVELRCKRCGCFERTRMQAREPITGDTWNKINGTGALPRMGGCDFECICHVESRDNSDMFSVTFGPSSTRSN